MKKAYEEPTISVFAIRGMEVIMESIENPEHDNRHDNWDNFE